ncbi:hypothetical protein NPIL_82911, partial [Nephila pilipes]
GENDPQSEGSGCFCDAKHNKWKYKYPDNDDCRESIGHD